MQVLWILLPYINCNDIPISRPIDTDQDMVLRTSYNQCTTYSTIDWKGQLARYYLKTKLQAYFFRIIRKPKKLWQVYFVLHDDR